jgi:elongation factor G
VEEARAGDIVALAKLKDTHMNDSLCAPGSSIRFEPIECPRPVVAYAVYPKSSGDEDKLANGLHRVAEDDPTISVERNAETHELILSGMGDVQLSVAVEHMKKRSNVDVDLTTPKVAYRETINGKAEGHHKHKKQSGGRGQYGEVYLRVEPKASDDEEWFVDEIVGGAIPSGFLPAVQKGLLDGMTKGALAGYPVRGVKVRVYDGSYHDVDSSEVAFKIAGARALRDAMSKAKPVLLEPVMKIRVYIPEQYLGDITGDLNHKRGRILGMGSEDGMQVLEAEVPQAEIFQYSSQLRSVTGGRGSFELEFARYDVVPSNVAQKIIAEAEKEKEED